MLTNKTDRFPPAEPKKDAPRTIDQKSVDWHDVLEFALNSFDGALAPNTLRAYRSDIESYADFCAAIGIAPFPATDENLVRLGEYLRNKQAFASIDRKWVAIARINRFAGFGSIGKSEYFKLQRKKLMRELGRRQRQALGLTKTKLEILESTCDLTTRRGLRDTLLLNLAYDTMRRRSELVELLIEDVEFDPSEGVGSILVRKSKSDQVGEGTMVPISSKTHGLIKDWMNVTGLEEGPILRSIYKSGKLKGLLVPQEVARLLRMLATAAGFSAQEVSEISGHSTRVGAAQDMMSNGKSTAQIMRRGTWKSPRMVIRYTERCGMKGLL